MIKFILILIMLLPSMSFADKFDYTFKTTKDNDGIQMHSSTMAFNPGNFGIGIRNTVYKTQTDKKETNSLLLMSNFETANYSLTGNLGIGHAVQKNYMSGDITGIMQVNKNFSLNMNIFGDLVDSESALQNNISMKGVVTGLDYQKDKFSMSIGNKRIWFDNQNIQNGYFVKPSYSIAEGINIYLVKKYYENSNPNNGYYFSPSTYDRSGVGITLRKRINSISFYGSVEKTNIKTPFEKSPAIIWKVEVKAPVYEKLNVKVFTGKDFNNSGSFFYRFFEVLLNYEF